jgi:hypothetical protein
MMRIGAALGDQITLDVGMKPEKIEALDKLPGWIGDEAPEEEAAGRLGVGAPYKLKRNRRYRCYELENEKWTQKDRF